MKNFLIILILLLLTGCAQTTKFYDNDIQDYIIHVKGYGLDVVFHPIFGVRCGTYEYIIINEDLSKQNK